MAAKKPQDQSPVKDPQEWTTGDEPMTGPQKSYLNTLARHSLMQRQQLFSRFEGAQLDDALKTSDKFDIRSVLRAISYLVFCCSCKRTRARFNLRILGLRNAGIPCPPATFAFGISLCLCRVVMYAAPLSYVKTYDENT